jgi:hypothetical protein
MFYFEVKSLCYMKVLTDAFLHWLVTVLLVLLVFAYDETDAQVKFEVREFTGIVKSIEPGWGLAYEVIRLDVDGDQVEFQFPQDYGKIILEKVKPDQSITLKVNVNITFRSKLENLKPDELTTARRFYREMITEIFLDGAWFPLPPVTPPRQAPRAKIFLEKKVMDVYKVSTYYARNKTKEFLFVRALIFENGLLGNVTIASQRTDDIKKGDIVSFMGYAFQVREGMAYPVQGVKSVYYAGLLNKNIGRLKSLLFKQNNVCIGIVMKTLDDQEVFLSFPSDYAERVRDFLTGRESVTFYHYHDYKIKGIIDPPEVHAFVAGNDSLMIDKVGFYGGADIKHDHLAAELSGVITQVNRTDKGKIMSVIVAKSTYVEIDQNIEQQLGPLLRKGKAITVKGEERIKEKGEIYQKDYRIIIPTNIVIEGKEFLLK